MLATDRDPLFAEIIKLRDHVALRDEEVRQLKETFVPILCFPREWRLTASETSILGALYNAKSGVLSKDALHIAISGLEVDTDAKIVDVFVCKIRAKVARFGIQIETRWGMGFALPPASRRVISAALAGELPAPAPPPKTSPKEDHMNTNEKSDADPISILLDLARREKASTRSAVLYDAAMTLIQSERTASANGHAEEPKLRLVTGSPKRRIKPKAPDDAPTGKGAVGIDIDGDEISYKGKVATIKKRQAEIARLLAEISPNRINRKELCAKVWGEMTLPRMQMLGQQIDALNIAIEPIGLKVTSVRSYGVAIEEA